MLAPAATRELAHDKHPTHVPIYFSLVVWGEAYVRMFLEFCLPSLLAPANLPAIRHRAGSRFVLHARAADLPVFERSPAFQRLKETIDVEVRFVRPEGLEPHLALTRCHRET